MVSRPKATETYKRDFRKALEWIEDHDGNPASMLTEHRAAVDFICENPLASPRLLNLDARRHVFKNYLIVYKAASGQVTLLRLLHQKQNFEELL